jgi:hypothetical protein
MTLSGPPRRARILFLIFLAAAAFVVRVQGVGSLSLCDAEVIKWRAVQQYQQGHFVGVNSEHPMLMKLMAWGSITAGREWNESLSAASPYRLNEETILRAPNLVVGAATTIVIFLFGNELLGALGGAIAAVFWAFLPLSIAINRLLKEDTLLIFFTYLAFYFYLRAKRETEDRGGERLYTLSGLCFGLALASKYYLHYLGLFLLFWHVAGGLGLDARPLWKTRRGGLGFWLAMGLAFVAANPVILSPTNDRAIVNYTEGGSVIFHGHAVNGQVYMNTIGSTPFGMPVYFYSWMIGAKTPLPVLVVVLMGIVMIFFARRSLAAIFLRIMLIFYFIPLSLADPKTIRYLCDMLPFIFLLGGFAVQRCYEWISRMEPVVIRRAAAVLAAVVIVIWPTTESLASGPYFTLYLNQAAGGRQNSGRFFPPDEIDDLGIRETVQYICQSAPAGAVLAVNNPGLVRYYLDEYHRQDIHLQAFYDPRYRMRAGDLVVLQESRRYFETEDLSALLKRHGQLLWHIKLGGVVTASIYRY